MWQNLKPFPGRHIAAVAAIIVFMAGCSSIDPYAPPPPSCEAVDREIAENQTAIDRVLLARQIKTAGTVAISSAIALGAIGPVAAVAIPFIDAARIDVADRQKRVSNLWLVKLAWGCFKNDG